MVQFVCMLAALLPVFLRAFRTATRMAPSPWEVIFARKHPESRIHRSMRDLKNFTSSSENCLKLPMQKKKKGRKWMLTLQALGSHTEVLRGITASGEGHFQGVPRWPLQYPRDCRNISLYVWRLKLGPYKHPFCPFTQTWDMLQLIDQHHGWDFQTRSFPLALVTLST